MIIQANRPINRSKQKHEYHLLMHNHMNFGPNYDGQDPKIDVELDKK